MRIILTDQTSPYEIIRQITESASEELTVSVAGDSFYSRHKSNLNFIKQAAQRLGKKVVIETTQTQQEEEVRRPEPEEASSEDEFPTQTLSPQKEIKTRGISILRPKRVLLFFLIFLIISLISGGFFVFYYLPRGGVSLFVSERVLEKSLEISVDTAVEKVSSEDLVIPGRSITVEAEETRTFQSTGKKTVGEKAKGVVEINNFTKTELILKVGTKLTKQTADGSILEFQLIEKGVVPKVTETSPTERTKVFEAGVKEVSIEAIDIGEQYNLSANSKFAVEGFDVEDVFAMNVNPLIGGLTREVGAVSAEDQNNASEQLRVKMFAEAGETLKQRLNGTWAFSESTIDHATKFMEFSHEVGAEADEFILTLRVDSSVTAYSEADLKDLLKANIKESVPEGFELSSENEVLKIEEAKMVQDQLLVKAKISALVIPVLDKEEIKRNLLGKKPVEAEVILQGIEQIEGYQVTLWPALPEILRTFPHLEDRLEIKVEVGNGE